MTPEIENILKKAISHHQKGELTEAESLYQEAIEIDPACAIAWDHLGVLAMQIQMYDVAEELLRQACSLEQNHPDYHYNLANALHFQGKHEEEIHSLRLAIQLKPDYFEAICNLGNTHHLKGEYDQAAAQYQNALVVQPDNAEIRFNLANTQYMLGQYALAENNYRRILKVQPDHVDTKFNLAKTLIKLEQYEEALTILDELIESSDNIDAWFQRAYALEQSGKREEALAAYEAIIEKDPDVVEAYGNLALLHIEAEEYEKAIDILNNAQERFPDAGELNLNLGVAYHSTGDLEKAKQYYQLALNFIPNSAKAQTNLGSIENDLGYPAQAINLHRAALLNDPDYLDAKVNLGIALQAQGNLEEAIENYEAVLEKSPGHAEAHWNHALALLQKGDYKKGWEEYEWRWHSQSLRKAYRKYAQPLWSGEDLSDKTLFIHHEQGLGDNLQFCRYLPLAAEKAENLIVECPGSLRKLYEHSFPQVKQWHYIGDEAPGFDYHAPIMSLPRAFGTTLDNVPGNTPYLRVLEKDLLPWKEKLKALGDKPCVGIVWGGNPRKNDAKSALIDRRRSIPLEKLEPLLSLDTVHWVSLQKGEAAEQLADTSFQEHIHDWTKDLQNFYDTACLIEQLDLVISVDTSVAHLAGALDKPVWVLSRLDGCWRWLMDRDDSPWYPSVRLFRQTRPGTWRFVIEDVVKALKDLNPQKN